MDLGWSTFIGDHDLDLISKSWVLSNFLLKKFWFCLIFFRLNQIWISFRRNFLNLREILVITRIKIFSYIFSKFYSFIIVKKKLSLCEIFFVIPCMKHRDCPLKGNKGYTEWILVVSQWAFLSHFRTCEYAA